MAQFKYKALAPDGEFTEGVMGAADRDGVNAMVAAAEANGTRVMPEYGSVWFTMNGRDQANARKHVTIAMPMATTESTGFPESRDAGGAWIMAAGTTTAHLMTPGG